MILIINIIINNNIFIFIIIINIYIIFWIN